MADSAKQTNRVGGTTTTEGHIFAESPSRGPVSWNQLITETQNTPDLSTEFLNSLNQITTQNLDNAPNLSGNWIDYAMPLSTFNDAKLKELFASGTGAGLFSGTHFELTGQFSLVGGGSAEEKEEKQRYMNAAFLAATNNGPSLINQFWDSLKSGFFSILDELTSTKTKLLATQEQSFIQIQGKHIAERSSLENAILTKAKVQGPTLKEDAQEMLALFGENERNQDAVSLFEQRLEQEHEILQVIQNNAADFTDHNTLITKQNLHIQSIQRAQNAIQQAIDENNDEIAPLREKLIDLESDIQNLESIAAIHRYLEETQKDNITQTQNEIENINILKTLWKTTSIEEEFRARSIELEDKRPQISKEDVYDILKSEFIARDLPLKKLDDIAAKARKHFADKGIVIAPKTRPHLETATEITTQTELQEEELNTNTPGHDIVLPGIENE